MFNLRLFQLQELGLVLPHEKCCFMIEDAGAALTDDGVPDRTEVHDEFGAFIIKNPSNINAMRVSFISVDSTTKELEIWLDL